MASPITSQSLRSPSILSYKISSSFAERKVSYLRTKLREELRDRTYTTPISYFLEHVLAAPETVLNEWDPFLDDLEKDDVVSSLKEYFLKKVAKEHECYKRFVVLANHIQARANSQFPPGPEAVGRVKFATTSRKIIKGDVDTPSRKPDIVLAEQAIAELLQQQPDTEIDWEHVLVAFEFKVKEKLLQDTDTETVSPSPGSSCSPSSPRSKRKSEPLSPASFKRPPRLKRRGLETKSQIQVADYAHEMLSSSHNTRMHALAVFVEDNLVRLWYYDRGGGIAIHGFIDIERDFKSFMKVIIAMTRLRLTEYGFFPIFDWPSGPVVPHSLEGASLTLGGHRMTFTEVISTRPGLVTRASLVWGVTCDTLPESVVKVSFQQVSRANEVELISYAASHHVDHLPVVHLWKDFGRLSEGVRSRLPAFPEPKNLTFDDRVLRVIVFKRYTPVYQLKALPHFKNAIRDVFDCIVQLHMKAGIVHRDISHTNIMAEEIDGTFRGILNDFDLAVRNNGPDIDSPSLERTGTFPFMAVALLNHPETIPHLFRYDLESMFYVLVWIAVHYDGDGKSVKTSQLADWKDAATPSDMCKAKDTFLKDPMKTLKLNPFYHDLEKWITKFSVVVKMLQVEPQYQDEKHRGYVKELEEQMAVSISRSHEPSWPLNQMNQMVQGSQNMSDQLLIETIKGILAD